MKHSSNINFLAVSLALLLVMSDCTTIETPIVSSFLGSYDEFETDPADESLLWWEQESFDWSNYRSENGV